MSDTTTDRDAVIKAKMAVVKSHDMKDEGGQAWSPGPATVFADLVGYGPSMDAYYDENGKRARDRYGFVIVDCGGKRCSLDPRHPCWVTDTEAKPV